MIPLDCASCNVIIFSTSFHNLFMSYSINKCNGNSSTSHFWVLSHQLGNTALLLSIYTGCISFHEHMSAVFCCFPLGS